MAVERETKGIDAGDGFRSALALYEGIEAEHMAALKATGVAFAPYDGERFAAFASGERASATAERAWPWGP